MAIPSGWYFCAASADLAPGQVLRKELFGEAWALWRTESGTAHLSSAVCPHLGSDLGKLGRVHGENLQCFSHRYRYDGGGDCVGTGMGALPCRTERVLRQLPVHEVGGFILAWYDAERGAPGWRMPDELFAETAASPFVRSEFTFDVPVQILNEDNFDTGHLYTWHNVSEVVSSQPVVDGPTISITHDFKRHSIFFQKPLPKALSWLSQPITSQYGSTLHGHGLTYSYIEIFNLGIRLQDFIWCTPISAERTLYTTFLRRRLPNQRRSPLRRLLDLATFRFSVRRLRQEHLHEGRGFWENQSRNHVPILTEAERRLLEPYWQWCRQFEPRSTPLLAARRSDENARLAS